MVVRAQELEKIAEKVLFSLGVEDYAELKLTHAAKAEGNWKVSFEYDHSAGFAKAAVRKIGSFVVDAKNGDIEGMWLDRAWK